jgi:hypothetical protein
MSNGNSEGTLRVARKQICKDFAVRYNVYVDGVFFGSLRTRQTLEFNVSSGSHRVEMAIPPTEKSRSNPLDIELQCGEVCSVVARGVSASQLLKLSTLSYSRLKDTPWIRIELNS